MKTKDKLFQSESEMQAWLNTVIDEDNQAFAALVSNSQYLDHLDPKNHLEAKFAASYRMAWRALQYLEILTKDENISSTKGEVLRPDFMLYDQDSQSIVLMELKNIAKTTREAGTEIGAYAAEIRNYLPFLSDGDIVSVLISNEWPTLLKHFIFNEVVWLGRTVICLEPERVDGKVVLRIKEFDFFLGDESLAQFPTDWLGGHCLCLYVSESDTPTPDDHLAQMRAAGFAMSSRGSALKNHGFAFLWQSTSNLSPYCFTIVNVASFQGISRLLTGSPPYKAINPTHNRLIQLVRRFNPQGHGISLSEITRYGRELVENWSSPRTECYTDWAVLRTDIDDNCVKMIGFYPWGLFAEVFHEELKVGYALGKNKIAPDCPDVGWSVVSKLTVDA